MKRIIYYTMPLLITLGLVVLVVTYTDVNIKKILIDAFLGVFGINGGLIIALFVQSENPKARKETGQTENYANRWEHIMCNALFGSITASGSECNKSGTSIYQGSNDCCESDIPFISIQHHTPFFEGYYISQE